MINAPEQEGYVGSMPDTDTQKYDKFIDAGTHFAFSVAAKRNIEIFQKPAGQGNMPSSPEFPDAGRTVRIVEILLEMKSEHPSKSDRHIAVAAEIKINLE